MQAARDGTLSREQLLGPNLNRHYERFAVPEGAAEDVREIGTAAGEATGEAEGISQQLSEVGGLGVTPFVDTTHIEEAIADVGTLRACLDGLSAPRLIGPVSVPSTPRPLGGRASGGPVTPGVWRVGEQGEELVSIGARGNVIDAEETRQILGSRRGTSSQPAPVVNMHFDVTIPGGANTTAADISRSLAREMRAALRTRYSDAV